MEPRLDVHPERRNSRSSSFPADRRNNYNPTYTRETLNLSIASSAGISLHPLGTLTPLPHLVAVIPTPLPSITQFHISDQFEPSFRERRLDTKKLPIPCFGRLEHRFKQEAPFAKIDGDGLLRLGSQDPPSPRLPIPSRLQDQMVSSRLSGDPDWPPLCSSSAILSVSH